MKPSLRIISVICCCLLLALSVSACSFIDEIAEGVKEGLAEGLAKTESPKGFETGAADSCRTIDASAYQPSPGYTPVRCTVSYDLLESSEEKELYRTLAEKIYTVSETVDLNNTKFYSLFPCEQAVIEGAVLTQAQISTAVKALYDDHPELFWLTTSYNYMTDEEQNYTAVILYSCYSSNDIDQWMPKLHEAVDSFTASVPEGLSEYERELYVHDYLIDNCFYNESDTNILEFYHSVYGVMVKGKAVCEGYAKAFQMLLNLLGVECVGITGDGIEPANRVGEKEEASDKERIVLHMWNGVKIEGEWYLVDVTWDDSEGVGERHLYLNGNDESFRSTHIPSKLVSELSDDEIIGEETYRSVAMNLFVPECTAGTYSYIIRECAHLDSYSDTEEIVDALYEAAQNGEESCVIYVDPSFSSMDDALDNIIREYPQYIFDYLSAVGSRLSDQSIDTEHIDYSYDEDLSVIIIYFRYI